MDPPPPPIRPTATHTHIIKPAVGCHYFPPGPQLPSQPSGITALRPVPSYTAWWQRWETCPELLRRSARPRIEPATSWLRVRHSTATPRRHPLNVQDSTVSYLSPALYLQDISSISKLNVQKWKLKIHLVDTVLVTNKKQCHCGIFVILASYLLSYLLIECIIQEIDLK